MNIFSLLCKGLKVHYLKINFHPTVTYCNSDATDDDDSPLLHSIHNSDQSHESQGVQQATGSPDGGQDEDDFGSDDDFNDSILQVLTNA